MKTMPYKSFDNLILSIPKSYLQVKKTNMKTQFTKVYSVMLFALFTLLGATAQTVSFDFTTGGTSSGSPSGYAIAGVGTFYRSTTGGTATISTATVTPPICNSQSRYMITSGSTIIFLTSTNVSKITVHGSGTGNNRILSTFSAATTLAGTYNTVATSAVTGTMTTGNVCGVITITPTATIAAGVFVRIVLSGNINLQQLIFDVPVTCTAPTSISAPSTSTQNICLNNAATALTATASGGTGTLTYQWYSNTSASNVGGTLLSGATNSSYTPLTSSVGSLYYYCIASMGSGCNITSAVSGDVNVLARPTPSFSTAPTSTTPINTAVTILH